MPRASSRAGRAFALLLPAFAACAPSSPAPGVAAPSATAAAITAADLRTRLGIFADDSMMGRGAGTPGNVKGTDYLAAEARRLGLTPAGENGTFFQTVPLVKRTLAPGAAVSAGGTTFAPMIDFIPRDQGKGTRPIDGVPVVDGGVYGDSARPALPAEQAAGKLVVIRVAPKPDGTPAGTVARAAVTDRFRSAAGIAVATLDAISPQERKEISVASAQLARDGAPAQPAFMYVTARMAEALVRAGTARGSLAFADSPADAPARNVVAILPGSDPALRGQLVALGAHNDHLRAGARAGGARLAPRLQRGDAAEGGRRLARRADGRSSMPGSGRPSTASGGSGRRGRTRSSTAPTTTAAAR